MSWVSLGNPAQVAAGRSGFAAQVFEHFLGLVAALQQPFGIGAGHFEEAWRPNRVFCPSASVLNEGHEQQEQVAR